MSDIYVISDIHLEFNTNYDISNFITPPKNNNSILIIAGDVCPIYMRDTLKKFLGDVCSLFKHVLYVPGNNEFYRVKNVDSETFTNLCKELDEYSETFSNLHILNNSCVSIGEYVFCGSILWSEANVELPNFFKISGFNKDIYNRKNTNDKKFIRQFIKETKDIGLKRVIITHYPPSEMCLKKYSGFSDKYRSLYYNNLDELFYEDLVWIYGHTHYNVDSKINNTRLVSNQYGKGKKNEDSFSNSFKL